MTKYPFLDTLLCSKLEQCSLTIYGNNPKREVKMFSQHFSPKHLMDLLHAEPPSVPEAQELLQKNSFTLVDISRMLLGTANREISRMITSAAHRVRRRQWNGEVFLMPPLYISNGDAAHGGCLDHCVYCPWRNGNIANNKLMRLAPEEVLSESTYLLQRGYGDIELVAATDPKLLKAGSAAEYITAAKNAGARNVGINFFPLRRIEDYRILAAARCAFAIVWQETYVEEVYHALHPRGPKANFQYRLDAHDWALQEE
jgi:2-iminoacetate synthase